MPADQAREPRSRWTDGRLYAATIDPLLSGVRGYIADHLPDGERVLDACCGTGALSLHLAREGRRVTGVDLSPRQIAYARSQVDGADRVRFAVADVAQLDPPADGRYDVAVVSMALHEMPAAARAPVLDNLAAVAERVMVLDFAAPMAWNVAGLRNRTAELAAGPAHFRSYLDYSRRGGLGPLIARDGLEVEQERRIDAGTLHVVVLRAAP